MSNIEFITNFNHGLNINHEILNKSLLYKKEHGGSYFKYIYDKLDNGFKLDQSTSTIIAYKDQEAIAVLIFFHAKNKNTFKIEYSYCNNIGTIGLFVKEEERYKGIAKKMIKEFENNFLDFYYLTYDFIIVNALEDSYSIAHKYFEWFIPCQKQNCNIQAAANISLAIHNGRRGLKSYLYQKKELKYIKH